MNKRSSNLSQNARLQSLFEAILMLENRDECERFFLDLCTPDELTALSDRWLVVQLLDKKIPYRQIQEQTQVSTATITRVARALQYGDDGYRRMLERIQTLSKKEKAVREANEKTL